MGKNAAAGFQPVGKIERCKMPVGDWECIEIVAD